MPVEVNPSSINSQQIEVNVNGPDDVNKMFIINGQANISLSASTSSTNQNVSRDETFKIKLDPHIKNTEFRRAIGNANFSDIRLFDVEDNPTNTFETLNFRITDVDADYGHGHGFARARSQLQGQEGQGHHAFGRSVLVSRPPGRRHPRL